jgi:hypothetical protein
MDTATKYYVDFIDNLVQYKGSSTYLRGQVRSGNLLSLGNDPAIAGLVSSLSEQQRETLTALLEQVAAAAVFDVLAYLNDREYRISKDGVQLPERPFSNALYDDYTGRRAGYDWEELEWSDS